MIKASTSTIESCLCRLQIHPALERESVLGEPVTKCVSIELVTFEFGQHYRELSVCKETL